MIHSYGGGQCLDGYHRASHRQRRGFNLRRAKTCRGTRKEAHSRAVPPVARFRDVGSGARNFPPSLWLNCARGRVTARSTRPARVFDGEAPDVALQTCLRALGFPVKKKEVLDILSKHAADGSERLDEAAFQEVMREKYLERNFDDLVAKAFLVFDLDANNKISLQNLKAVARDLGFECPEDELRDMIDMFDKDGDGSIDKGEFKQVLRAYDPYENDED